MVAKTVNTIFLFLFHMCGQHYRNSPLPSRHIPGVYRPYRIVPHWDRGGAANRYQAMHDALNRDDEINNCDGSRRDHYVIRMRSTGTASVRRQTISRKSKPRFSIISFPCYCNRKTWVNTYCHKFDIRALIPVSRQVI